MNWKPNKWIAALLGLVLGPIGGLYAGFPVVAVLIVFALIATSTFSIALSDRGTHAGH